MAQVKKGSAELLSLPLKNDRLIEVAVQAGTDPRRATEKILTNSLFQARLN